MIFDLFLTTKKQLCPIGRVVGIVMSKKWKLKIKRSDSKLSKKEMECVEEATKRLGDNWKDDIKKVLVLKIVYIHNI